MLQNAYLVVKIGADTAENERHFAEILPKTGNDPTGPPSRTSACRRTRGPGSGGRSHATAPCGELHHFGKRKGGNEWYDLDNQLCKIYFVRFDTTFLNVSCIITAHCSKVVIIW